MISNRALDPRLYRFSLTPFGRTPPLDESARRVLGLRLMTPFHIFGAYLLAGYFVCAVAVTLILELGRHAGVVSASAGTTLLTSGQAAYELLALLFLALLPLSLAFWQIRRLHDTNRSGTWLLVPLGAWALRLVLPFAVLFGSFSLLEIVFAESRAILAVMALIAAFAAATAYEHFVFTPHRRQWKATVTQAPGDPGPNRFGPPRQ